MTAREDRQRSPDIRAHTIEPLALLGVANALFDPNRNPRMHPRVFYLGYVSRIVAQLTELEGVPAAFTYAAKMDNNTVHVGHHVWTPPSSSSPRRIECSGDTRDRCTEYVVTEHGLHSVHDSTEMGWGMDDKAWERHDARNGLAVAAHLVALKATDCETDLFHAESIWAGQIDRFAAEFASHLPCVMQNAIAQVQAARQSPGS